MEGIETEAGKSEGLQKSGYNPSSPDGSDEAKTESMAGFIEHAILGFLYLVLSMEFLIFLGTAAFIFLVSPAISPVLDYIKLIGKKFLSLLVRSAGGANGA